jgi:hypothetical protein
MINLRYHIVSITAVFLALGIGLTLGSTFLDRATVENVKGQLETLEEKFKETDARNAELNRRVDRIEDRDRLLAEQLPERLTHGLLEGVPVLVIAEDGVDEDIVHQTVSALIGADARVAGTWWLTERFALDDESERRDLGAALGLSSSDAERLRRNAMLRVSDLLLDASAPVEGQIGAGGVIEPVPPQAIEPELIAALRSAGFIEYEVLPGAVAEQVLVPQGGARFVVIGGAGADVDERFLRPLMTQMTLDGPAPILAAQGTSDPAADEEARISFVGPLRDDEIVGSRLSTVDDLDSAAGLAGTVLAVVDLGELKLGHYGISDTASRLLPAPEPTG